MLLVYQGILAWFEWTYSDFIESRDRRVSTPETLSRIDIKDRPGAEVVLTIAGSTESTESFILRIFKHNSDTITDDINATKDKDPITPAKIMELTHTASSSSKSGSAREKKIREIGFHTRQP